MPVNHREVMRIEIRSGLDQEFIDNAIEFQHNFLARYPEDHAVGEWLESLYFILNRKLSDFERPIFRKAYCNLYKS